MIFKPSKVATVIAAIAASLPGFASDHACVAALFARSTPAASRVIAAFDSALLAEAKRELSDFVKFRSASVGTVDPAAMAATARYVAQLLRQRGIQNVLIEEVEGSAPLVTGSRIISPTKPTLLFYGHYDVQSAGDPRFWDQADPYLLEEREGRYFGRGVADNKGGIIAFLTVLRAYENSGREFPVNLKFVIEGGEESGANLGPILAKKKAGLAADVVLVCDSVNESGRRPSIVTSLRGSYNLKLTARSAKAPLHSGLTSYAPNPAKFLARVLGELENSEGQLQLAGLYDQVPPFTDPIAGDTDVGYAAQAKLLPGVTIVGHGANEASYRLSRWPALNFTGIDSDVGGVGEVNKIPSEAWTYLGIRSIPGMTPEGFRRALWDFIDHRNVNRLQIELTLAENPSPVWRIDSERFPLRVAQAALEAGHQQAAVFSEKGASLPVINHLQTTTGAGSVILYAVADHPESLLHAPNENLSVETFSGAIRSTIYLVEAFGNSSRESFR